MGVVNELGVENSEGSVSIDGVSGLLAVAVLERRVLVLSNLEPGASVLSGVEVGLQSGSAALATADAGVN